MTELRADLFASDDLLLVPERMLLESGCEAGQAMVVRGAAIVDVGPREEVLARHRDLAPLELPGHLIMPGTAVTRAG